ncbi:MAG: HIT domain-containing protein [Planctomycetes bacterium]|nr:HIT domain-containing protein [Planctomycetota bacterium]
MDCVFCSTSGGQVVHAEADARIVWPHEAEHPALLRVVTTAHVRELTDLAPAVRQRVFTLVCAAESALRSVVAPAKINVASLGNVVPHVHWHVVPRYVDDAYFPQPIWASKLRDAAPRPVRASFAADVAAAIVRELSS